MLTGEIKRQINTARDILVGKIPDPKGQITQITNALIYKFMDDQDRLAQTLPGGKATFFTGELAPYTWHKLFDSKLSNQDKANLYIEGLEKLSKSKHLPELFQDIFKEAFLPFRAPDTIAMFLTTINTFDYHHSEDLGNAFEYLLSIMGSQGDAGQFRTPRNIIEFIVDAVNPQKEETILDPACGTAGFLVESYKHITESKKLSPREIQELADHIYGVDIDPGMAKIARVNLYLHGFKTPHITENDTLTNESLWGKKYDVILANPPFMTPKGGIKPHDKFIKATKAEVLFTDYIAEHLKLAGRAGVIVPEGIIERSGTVYKQLRKKLVDDKYLWAVISLPAGVFNPYSGVKTSILLLDRKRASENSEILFVKVTNDGFDLGAQRREIDKNNLPEALSIIEKWRKNEKVESSIVLYVDKAKVAESDDYVLSGDRYFKEIDYTNAKWPMVELGEVCDIFNGSTPKRSVPEYWENGLIPWFTIDDIRTQGRIIFHTEQKITDKGFSESSVKLLPKHSTLLCCTASVGECAYTEIELTTNQQFNGLVVNKDYIKKLNPKYLFWCATTFKNELERVGGKAIFGFVSVGKLKKFKIPLPPLEIQEQIVAELDGYAGIIDGAKKITENWKPKIEIDQEWNKVKIGELVEEMHQGVNTAADKVEFVSEGFPIIQARDITSGILNIKETKKLSNTDFKKYKAKYNPEPKNVLLSNIGTVGKSVVVSQKQDFIIAWNVFILKLNRKILPDYLKICFDRFDADNYWEKFMTGGTVRFINKKTISDTEIPLPSLEIQGQIVEKIEAERSLVESSRKLIEIYEGKSKEVIKKLWNE